MDGMDARTRHPAVLSRRDIARRKDMRMRQRALVAVDCDKPVVVDCEPALFRPSRGRRAQRGDDEVDRLNAAPPGGERAGLDPRILFDRKDILSRQLTPRAPVPRAFITASLAANRLAN